MTKIAKYLAAALLASGALLFAVAPTVINRVAQWPPQAGPAYSFGGPYEVATQAAPTSTTAVTSATAHIIGFCVTNTTAGALVFTLASKEGTPTVLPGTQSVPANSYKCENWPFGVLALSGFSVLAGGAGLNYSVVWTN